MSDDMFTKSPKQNQEVESSNEVDLSQASLTTDTNADMLSDTSFSYSRDRAGEMYATADLHPSLTVKAPEGDPQIESTLSLNGGDTVLVTGNSLPEEFAHLDV